MSDTASFVDPVFLARFGLSRVNVLDYFLHPLNPFRTKVNTSNEVLGMQGIAIGVLVQQGTNGIPMTPQAAEEEYTRALTRLTGEQYELMPPVDPAFYIQPSPLYTIRHVLRTGRRVSDVKVLGIYYVVEGVIYKSPSMRSLMKTNVARTLEGLAGASAALSQCARYQPSFDYSWNFADDDDTVDPVQQLKNQKAVRRRRILDGRAPGERTEAEEEGLRASLAIDQILVRLSKSRFVSSSAPVTSAATAASSTTMQSTATIPTITPATGTPTKPSTPTVGGG
uniref:Mediator of RNA polymerase II transcription subunit 6 n=1 Tax=Craspedostauros australis TaxID=1486917 RepID=A0A7R9ZQ52_9STRA|mmetsp:Transcript_5013/g.13323  ORF Transcript_5013/g.13323 Transcript_5013/m.13323 type:complete len:282 (+) Transcript_5013:248-1093(+)|eukprot:CAMPEP_0198134348 /NCGR_PEP_ID=MMETSP1442-20131203/60032_1 /TAXON_ID= /ORGANISM="Craspedostauros australis, Strain CCMP3328" /LENGTH=281 /DNA_ID=CAMNT_0043795491 /DNA_START=173 /DNA_END=1018 /DNA_ORIENTATION=+